MSRQSYYRAGWRQRHRRDVAAQVVAMVGSVRRDLPRVGTRKLYHILKEPLSALGVGRDKLFAILKANNMDIKPQRSYRMTTYSKHMFRKHKNLIIGVEPTRPEQIWVSDITYIGSRGNHQYLSLVTDAYSKKILGYDLSENLHAQGSIRALSMAIKNRHYKDKPLIHHSDRGIQYCCEAYQNQIEKNNLICSMTESYDPYANAVAERINGIIKAEFELEKYTHSKKLLRAIVGESIHAYNTLRPHYSCGMLTPERMHKQNKVRIKTYRKKLVPKSLGD